MKDLPVFSENNKRMLSNSLQLKLLNSCAKLPGLTFKCDRRAAKLIPLQFLLGLHWRTFSPGPLNPQIPSIRDPNQSRTQPNLQDPTYPSRSYITIGTLATLRNLTISLKTLLSLGTLLISRHIHLSLGAFLSHMTSLLPNVQTYPTEPHLCFGTHTILWIITDSTENPTKSHLSLGTLYNSRGPYYPTYPSDPFLSRSTPLPVPRAPLTLKVSKFSTGLTYHSEPKLFHRTHLRLRTLTIPRGPHYPSRTFISCGIQPLPQNQN